MAKAIAFATPQRCPSARRGPKPLASARPALGPRASRPPGRALACVVRGERVFAAPFRRGGGKAVRFLFPPGDGVEGGAMHFHPSPAPMAKAIAFATPRRCHPASRGPRPRPAPAPPTAGASRPPGRALAFVVPGPAGLQGTVPSGRGKRGAFPVPARSGGGTASPPWQGPSPLPQPHAGIRSSRGPKPPASARPRAGRFASAGSGAGLRCAGCEGLCRIVPQGRGKRGAFPAPARRRGGTGQQHLNMTGRPRPLSKEILVTISPAACVLFTGWSCDRRQEFQMR